MAAYSDKRFDGFKERLDCFVKELDRAHQHYLQRSPQYYIRQANKKTMNSGIRISPLDQWGLPIEKFFMVAGPCSAESREQIMEIAEALSSMGISCMRAGAWKPRTQPGSVEGYGEEALDWLVEARELYNIEICTEVALPEHVEACLKRNIKVVWIGTRTTANPFSVQELANAMQSTDMKVLVKNPICPEIQLWVGAIERFYNSGIETIIAIHRGFSVPYRSKYRYPPLWELTKCMKKYLPDIPVILDPSHISGNHILIEDIINQSKKYGYDGFMIEVHNHPEFALTDSRQQLTTSEFHKILKDLSAVKSPE